jgi:hypothetical protein
MRGLVGVLNAGWRRMQPYARWLRYLCIFASGMWFFDSAVHVHDEDRSAIRALGLVFGNYLYINFLLDEGRARERRERERSPD